MNLAETEGLARLEAVLFAAPAPLGLGVIAEALGLPLEETLDLLADYRQLLEEEPRGFLLQETGGEYRLVSRPEYAESVAWVAGARPERLSRAALETLAVVAYYQPITRAEIDRRRGVKSAHSLEVLLEVGLVLDVGRRDGTGRPILYGTGPAFLEFFGLGGLEELPELPVTFG